MASCNELWIKLNMDYWTKCNRRLANLLAGQKSDTVIFRPGFFGLDIYISISCIIH